MAEVEKKINYEFKNKVWLVEALTHKSFMDSNKQRMEETVSESIEPINFGFNEQLMKDPNLKSID